MVIGPSPGLAASQKRWMRSMAQYREVQTPDGSGGYSTSWTKVADIIGSLAPPTATEFQTAEQDGVEYDYMVKVPMSSTVIRRDRLIDATTGVTVEVVDVIVGTHSVVKVCGCVDEPWNPPDPEESS